MQEQSQFRIGTCGYSYPGEPPQGWYGVFYPKTARKRVDELEFYASVFDAVEINSTFYRPPLPATASAWARRTPQHFRFAVKAWQKFTHATKLGEKAGESRQLWDRFDDHDVELFTTGIAPLKDSGKLGILLFQYPASFHFAQDNVKRLEATLSAFASYPKAVELRHRSWSDRLNETQSLLDRSLTAWAYIDEPKFASSVRQTIRVSDTTAYLRLHGRNYQKWWKHDDTWERYDYFYNSDQIRQLGDKIRRAAAPSPDAKFYVFFNNHARGQAVANALMLKAELNLGVPGPVPQGLLQAFPAVESFLGEPRLAPSTPFHR